jgi:hypothetical protein
MRHGDTVWAHDASDADAILRAGVGAVADLDPARVQ